MRKEILRETARTKAPPGSGVGAVDPLQAVAAADEGSALGGGTGVETPGRVDQGEVRRQLVGTLE